MRQWRYGVISLLRTHYPTLILPPELETEGNSPQSWNAFLDRNYNSHWNVSIAKNISHKTHTAKYLGSYVKNSPIAAARLADYTGGDMMFTYLTTKAKAVKI